MCRRSPRVQKTLYVQKQALYRRPLICRGSPGAQERTVSCWIQEEVVYEAVWKYSVEKERDLVSFHFMLSLTLSVPWLNIQHLRKDR